MDSLDNKKIVFFDGVCNLCNRAVDFLLENDTSNSLLFSSLTGIQAKKILGENSFDSIIFWDNKKIFKKSQAVFALVDYLPWYWGWIKIFKLLPTSWSDIAYDLVAKYRYKIFGKRDQCRIASAKEKARFLD